MNTRRPLRWLWLSRAAVFLFLLFIVNTAGMQVPGGASKSDVKTNKDFLQSSHFSVALRAITEFAERDC